MDEDLEFRDMVLKKLTESGSLLEIKAKLRTLLYDVISKEQPRSDSTNESDVSSSTFEKDTEATIDGKTVAFELILEMLESLNLQYSKQIFMVESGLQKPPMNRNQLIHQLGLKVNEVNDSTLQQPILLKLIDKCRQYATENSCDIDSAPDLSLDSKPCSSTMVEENVETHHGLSNTSNI